MTDAPLRVVIVDDEPLARDALRLALEAEPDVEVVAECADGPSAVSAIARKAPDLVFLDVQMPGMDGFDVIAAVGPARMPPVVFVTAFDRHAVRAFSVHALDYVLKPFDDQRFREAVAHARRQVALRHQGDLASRLDQVLRSRTTAAGAGYATRFRVEDDDERIRFVPVEEIRTVEADGNYVLIRDAAGLHRIRSTLKAVEERLDPARFIRVHRSIIVNVTHVREVQPSYGGEYVAIMDTGRRAKVSRGHQHRLLKPTH
ncbi:MAG: LytR/AlgR family response regulator transcription factor [Gemmatimonadales bacterium]